MKKNLFILLMLVFALGTLSACSSDETSKEKAKSEETKTETETDTEKEEVVKEEEESEKEEVIISTTVEEIVNENSGKYSANAYNEAVVHRDLDEQSFQDKDSFQVYDYLLGLMSESETYKEFYDFAEDYHAGIETTVSGTPEGMTLDDGQVVNGTSNIAILLDASGSMAQKIGGKTKMELANKAINDFVASMPEGANVSLRVYGHKGSNSDSDKKVSCSSTEVVYELNPYNESNFKDSLNSFKPTGWTPIANAINETKKDFDKVDDQAQNIIYVVSDGIETCDGDPVEAAKNLHDSNIKAVINIIGLDVNTEGQKQLLKVAEAGGGKYEAVGSADDFKRVWEKERVRLYNEWSSWSAKNYNEVSAEQSEKVNELYGKKADFTNLTYDEKKHLNDAIYYLQQKEQISSEVRGEIQSFIEQRHKIMVDYQDRYKDLIDQTQEAGKAMKEDIQEKGKEMKDKYKN